MLFNIIIGETQFDYYRNSIYNVIMKTFQYAEEYLQIISGIRDLVTGKMVYNTTPFIKLARYDVDVLTNISLVTTGSGALTERQADLAIKIILKYQRQLAAKGVDVSPMLTPKWQVTPRKMDYSRKIYIDNDTIIVKFPYEKPLIDALKKFIRDSQGTAHWDRDLRVWKFALTEYNINWIHEWASINSFEIDPAIYKIIKSIAEVEQAGYAIELKYDGETVAITNAAPSLTEYITTNICEVTPDNLIKLVDISSVFGYTINKDIADALVTEYGPRFYNLLSNRELRLASMYEMTIDNFQSIIDYADQLQRWPVVIYEPDLHNRMLDMINCKRPNECFSAGQRNLTWYESSIIKEHRYIHITTPTRYFEKIPLLISSAGIIFGGDKEEMLRRAEKVVYCTNEVYNKRKSTIFSG